MGASPLGDLQKHMGKLGHEPWQSQRKHLHGALDADPQPEPAAVLLPDRLDLGFQALAGGQDDPGSLQIFFPCEGGPEGGHAPVEQRDPQFGLHLFEHLAQGRLADIELFCGGGDTAFLRDGADIMGLFQVHRKILPGLLQNVQMVWPASALHHNIISI